MLIFAASCRERPAALSSDRCPGFALIPTTAAEQAYLFPEGSEPPKGIDPKLWSEMRLTYAQIAAHNRYMRENCG